VAAPPLSKGERFRADLARIVCEWPAPVAIDEFTSVVDRQIARIDRSSNGVISPGRPSRRLLNREQIFRSTPAHT
jgi:hypothetical protein